ncbi:hypothetical protein AYL99_08274 [Fonsecaea erecta]|uniref:Peptidase metallopeptidase domain-containing protein n=1 Tax=Fonsecaea erecta TaxID=1367422 RepID=A0A178ZDK1_9EURO|nr:hypothetical protein AYL99_08274 [Fonsecaea erecta]OAP57536.1 hypothetical protein AYL99_08274 [Fonsecaea erecta]
MSKKDICSTKIPNIGDLDQNQASHHHHTPENASRLASLADRGVGRLAAERYFLWNPGSTIHVKFLGGSPQLQRRVAAAASTWLNYANLHVQFFSTGQAEIRIAFDQDGHWSYVGTHCLQFPDQRSKTMNLQLTDRDTDEEVRRVALHEFGHALGCVHEHQSPRARIRWRTNYVYAWYWNHLRWSSQEVYNQVIKPYESAEVEATGFDLQSIMIYPILREFTEDGISVGWITNLSYTDTTYISQLYPSGGGGGGSANGGDINARDEKGRTALHRAAESGDESKVTWLLKQGASVDLQEYVFGYTPLHTAVWNRHPKVVLLLLLQGARKDLKTTAGFTPLGLANLWRYSDIIALLQ